MSDIVSECMQSTDILEKILIFLEDVDLYALMQTCKTIRNIVGQSNVWIHIRNWMNFDGIFEYINIDAVVELFMSIKISKKNFAIQPYYGKYYYLYIMKMWIAEGNNDFWSIYSLINNQGDIKKLYKLCCHIHESEYASQYYELIDIIEKLGKKLGEITHIDRDKILQMIYINDTFTDGKSVIWSNTKLYISNVKIKYNHDSKKQWYPLTLFSAEPTGGDFYYKISHSYDSKNMTISKNRGDGNDVNSGIIRQKILEISKDMNVDFNTLFNILRILLGKCIPYCVNKIDQFIEYADNSEDDDEWEGHFYDEFDANDKVD